MFKIISEGGYFFMIPLVLLLIAVIILSIKGNIGYNENSKKTLNLLQSLGLFALVWGILGQVLGLIGALDQIENIDGVSMNIVAGGLKITFLPTFLGAVVFLMARIGIILIQWREKE